MDEITRIATIVLVGILGMAGIIILLGWISKIRKKWGRGRSEKGMSTGCVVGFVILGLIVLLILFKMLAGSFPWIYWNKGL
jgi:hypothetical protein